MQIATQALESSVLSELDEKYEIFFTETDATLDLCTLGQKQEFCVEVIPIGKRELLDFKTDSTNDFWRKSWKLEMLESFEDYREIKELTMELLETKGVNSALLNEKEVISQYEGFNKAPCISNGSKS